VLLQRRVDRRKEAHQVAEVAPKILLGPRVLRRRHHLGKVDDHRAAHARQNVELRQVAMNEVGGQHLDDLAAKEQVHRAGLLGGQPRVDQPRRDPALCVADHLHQQHAFVEQHGLRHANARRVQGEHRVGFGRLPRLFRGLATERRALVHRALGAGVSHLAAFLVARVVLEAAKLARLVDLRGDGLTAVAHQPDLSLFAGLQLLKDFVDDAFFEELLQPLHLSLSSAQTASPVVVSSRAGPLQKELERGGTLPDAGLWRSQKMVLRSPGASRPPAPRRGAAG
jgi:hypothetical protein